MAEPVRTCVGCRRRAAAGELVRVAWDETARALTIDGRRRLGGRGAWLHPSASCLDTALRRKAFGRALRRTVVPAATESLKQQVDDASDPRISVGSIDAASSRLA